MFSRGETRVSLAPSLFLCSSERENREARNECKRWSVGWSVARTDSAYNLRLASTFLFSWKITERRCAGKIDTLRPLFAADNKNGKKKSLLFLHRGKRGAFSSPPLSLFLSFAGRAFRKRSSSSSRNPSSWWSARREFKVSPIVPGAGVRRGGKRRTRRSSAKVEMSSTSSKDNATGATKPLCVKRFHPLHAPFYLFFFPPFFSTGNRQHLCLSALGETRRSLYSFERLIPRVCRPVLFHPGRGIDFSTLLR